MEPNRVEFQKQCIFQSFCKRVLHNEACNAHEEIRRRRAKEVSFSDLALHEERQLYTLDKYFQDEEAEPSYQQAGKKITPKLLLEAIRTLPEEKRKARPDTFLAVRQQFLSQRLDRRHRYPNEDGFCGRMGARQEIYSRPPAQHSLV